VTGEATDWCKAGTYWSWSGASQGQQQQTNMMIRGLEQFKGAQYCNATVEATGTEDFVIEYYFKEENNKVVDVWMIMKDKSGTSYRKSIQ